MVAGPGIDRRHGLVRRAPFDLELVAVARLETRSLHLVTAGERLHLSALGLLLAEIDLP